MEYYSGVQTERDLAIATARMALENIMPSKSKKYKYHIMSLICRIQKKQNEQTGF